MTPERIAELRALAGAATVGPYRVDGYDVLCPDDSDAPRGYTPHVYFAQDCTPGSAAYIAAACNELPAALDEIERLRELHRHLGVIRVRDAKDHAAEIERLRADVQRLERANRPPDGSYLVTAQAAEKLLLAMRESFVQRRDAARLRAALTRIRDEWPRCNGHPACRDKPAGALVCETCGERWSERALDVIEDALEGSE